mmetsp:Transcript_7716/g.20022  ORF Transcript_7716/g.20022 Transcript_7716/m.20022 type:complete len:234 (+) Transcript_7716:25-726(+)|eukprot:CAMPEP_0113895062 /NCGR_PEP_ID=MMETSP0780_2-20120614/17120_1 /TAXON_ID=652834 /ORGANISM="Palpitomonas bilix" /LENGTH=233 /DNA_ID=CAMNT_0000885783 /DNA_START=25 /DNA_END=726 /DNA_ORIENTATION=- /assembly_acc=CAM_ASM_000599
MDAADAKKQIDQMVAFIKSEARSKADEIMVRAEEEFNILKQKEVEAQKQLIRKEYEKKSKQVEVEKRIAYSTEVNANRLRVLEHRDKKVALVKEDARKKLAKAISNGEKYKQLLQSLIVQGFVSLMEKDVTIKCRKEDETAVNSVVEAAVNEFKNSSELAVNVTVSKDYLPSGPEKVKQGAPSCLGGVVLSTKDGRIQCANTLDARLDIAYEQLLPDIKKNTFGASKSRQYLD